MHRRLAAAATLCATLLLAACTQHAPQPPPPPASGPKMPSDAPSSAAPSPSASPTADPEAADEEAVKQAYRKSFSELNRLEVAGGANELTQVLLNTTSGQHRQHYLQFLRDAKRRHIHQTKPGILVGISIGSYSASTVHFTACEDYSKTAWMKANGSKVNVKQPVRYLQHAIAKKGKDHRWRIDYIETTDVKSFRGLPCGSGAQ